MRKLLFLLALAAAACGSPESSNPETARWESRAQDVTIIRDDWGIAHVYGTTDADAVFGMIYAQAEDDFNRVEVNYLNSMGRLAEAEGEGEIWRDLRMRLFIDPTDMQAKYAASPEWLRQLMDAWADGLNYYLSTHPEVKPKVLTRFEPWMALTFSEGSIGGDIERVSLRDLEAFYGKQGGDATESAAAEPAVARRARARFASWRASPERRLLGVDAGILADALGDPFAEEYFAAWFRGDDLGEFLLLVDPAAEEPLSLGQFVPLDVDARGRIDSREPPFGGVRGGRSRQHRAGNQEDTHARQTRAGPGAAARHCRPH